MTDGDRRALENQADAGRYVSFIHDVPDVPADVLGIYEGYLELRNSTSSDVPIEFSEKLVAYEVYAADEFGICGSDAFPLATYLRFLSALDETFLKHQKERRERERETKKARKPKDPRDRIEPRKIIGKSDE
jgi:hypothetical protein